MVLKRGFTVVIYKEDIMNIAADWTFLCHSHYAYQSP